MSCCVCIEQSEVGIIEDCGKFSGEARPGCNMLVPCKQRIAGRVSLRVQDIQFTVESKTKDNVFCDIHISLQYQVLPDAVDKAFYTLEDPVSQISSYVYNSLRGKIPMYDIDQVFLMRGEIANALKEEVDHQMDHYGFDIVTVLIIRIDPAQSVREAMDLIQTNQRMKAAAVDKAEAQKISIVRAAEADAEAKRLSGVGLAEQRKAIVGGLQSSIEHFRDGVQELSSQEVMSLLLMNQYFDTLKDIAVHSSGSTLFVSHAGGLDAVAQQMTNGILSTKKTL